MDSVVGAINWLFFGWRSRRVDSREAYNATAAIRPSALQELRKYDSRARTCASAQLAVSHTCQHQGIYIYRSARNRPCPYEPCLCGQAQCQPFPAAGRSVRSHRWRRLAAKPDASLPGQPSTGTCRCQSWSWSWGGSWEDVKGRSNQARIRQ